MSLVFLIATLYISGLYLLLRRSLVRSVIGVLLLGHAANLLIFVVAGPIEGVPLIEAPATQLSEPYPDPLPQALVLTAIVIGLGVGAYLLALIRRTAALFDGDNIDDLREEV